MAAPPQLVNRSTYALVTAAGLAFSLLWALLCLLIVEFMQSSGDFSHLLHQTLDNRLALFLLGGILVWSLLLLLWALSGRLRVAAAVLVATAIVVGYANAKKISLRLEPLYPSDFAFAQNTEFLRHMVGVGTIAALTAIVALVTGSVWLAGRVIGRSWPRATRRQHPRRWLAAVIARVLVVVITLGVLGYATQFNETGNRVRATYESAGAHWAFWFQRLNYARNGFVGGMLYNFRAPSMDEPAGYGPDTMAEISQRYTSKAERWNRSSAPHDLDDVNIVLVLGEAFSDPQQLDGVDYEHDPIPFTRELMRSTTSGTMLAQLYGGGTANMEFEVLTGMSLSQFKVQMQTPYQMMVPNYDSFPSFVGFSKGNGHRPIAIHPYMTSMYKREAVYRVFGFAEFLGEDEIASPRRLGTSEFISDQTVFGEVTRQIHDNDDPLLINLVTMQNHYPYKDLYGDTLAVSGVRGEVKAHAMGYGRGLQHTDKALKVLLAELRDSNEKTAVVFYGDHQPAFWPGHVQKRSGKVRMLSTPFFLWANFPLNEERVAPLTSPIYFLPLLFKATSAPIPPYYALLLEMYNHIPAMEQGMYFNADGTQMEESDLPARTRTLLRDYRLVQYDLSIGERYSVEEMFYPVTARASAPAD